MKAFTIRQKSQSDIMPCWENVQCPVCKHCTFVHILKKYKKLHLMEIAIDAPIHCYNAQFFHFIFMNSNKNAGYMYKCVLTCMRSVIYHILAYFKKHRPFTARGPKRYHLLTNAAQERQRGEMKQRSGFHEKDPPHKGEVT